MGDDAAKVRGCNLRLGARAKTNCEFWRASASRRSCGASANSPRVKCAARVSSEKVQSQLHMYGRVQQIQGAFAPCRDLSCVSFPLLLLLLRLLLPPKSERHLLHCRAYESIAEREGHPHVVLAAPSHICVHRSSLSSPSCFLSKQRPALREPSGVFAFLPAPDSRVEPGLGAVCIASRANEPLAGAFTAPHSCARARRLC